MSSSSPLLSSFPLLPLLFFLLVLLPLTSCSDSTDFGYTTSDGIWSGRWSFSEDLSVVNIELAVKFDGWIAIALSESPTMDRADYIMGWVDPTNGSLSIADRYTNPTNSRYTPKTDLSLGGKEDLFDVQGSREVVDGVVLTKLSFSRLCNTGDEYDLAITDRNIYVLWGYGAVSYSGSPSSHSPTDRGAVSLNLLQGTIREMDRRKDFIVIHSCLMVISWSLLVVPMAILARYFKHAVQSWFKIHMIVNIFALLAVLTAFILIILLEAGFVVSAHAIIGTVVVGLGVFQGFLGKISDCLWHEGKIPSCWPDKLHWIMGYIIIVLAVIANFLGFTRLGVDNVAFFVYAGYIFVTVVFIIFLEVHVGQTGEYEAINDGEGSEGGGVLIKTGKATVALFWIYLAVASGLVTATLYLAFGASS